MHLPYISVYIYIYIYIYINLCICICNASTVGRARDFSLKCMYVCIYQCKRLKPYKNHEKYTCMCMHMYIGY